MKAWLSRAGFPVGDPYAQRSCGHNPCLAFLASGGCPLLLDYGSLCFQGQHDQPGLFEAADTGFWSPASCVPFLINTLGITAILLHTLFNLILSTKSLLPCKITYSVASGIKT